MASDNSGMEGVMLSKANISDYCFRTPPKQMIRDSSLRSE